MSRRLSITDRIVPELRHCRTTSERKTAESKLLSPVELSALVVGMIAFFFVPRELTKHLGLFMFPVLIAANFVYWYLGLYLLRANARRRVRCYLQSRGMPICGPCGYDLRGLPLDSTTCPECSHRIPPDLLSGELARRTRETPLPAEKPPGWRYRFCRFLASELRLARSDFERNECMYRAGLVMFLLTILFLVIGTIELMIDLPIAVAALTMTHGPSLANSIFRLLAVAGVASIMLILFARSLRKHTRAFLHARGVPICLNCGYDLRAATPAESPRCPECGEPRDSTAT